MADNQSKAIVVVVVMVGFVAYLFLSGSSDEGQFSGRMVEFNATDQANLFVLFSLTNDGTEESDAECFFAAVDLSGDIIGSDILGSDVPVAPGETTRFNGFLKVEDLGAQRVVDVQMSDCAEV